MTRDILDAHFIGLIRKPAPNPDPSECLRVVSVGRGSIAAEAGLQPGDLLHIVEGRTGATVNPIVCLEFAEERRYGFYSPVTKERIDIHATAIDIGADLEFTLEAALTRFDKNADHWPEYLRVLWEGGKWPELEKIAKGIVAPGWFSAGNTGTPAAAALGAAMIELGQRQKGVDYVADYLKVGARSWGPEWVGIARYAVGRALEADNNAAQAAEQYRTAAKYYDRSERIAAALERVTGSRPKRSSKWEGREIPLRWKLPGHEAQQGQEISISEAISTMEPWQVAVVCVLGPVRANGQYSTLMLRWANYARHFEGRIGGFFAVTSVGKRPADKEEQLQSEDIVVRNNLPFTLVLDREDEVSKSFGIATAPTVFVLDRSGRILIESTDLDGADWWEALSKVQLPPQTNPHAPGKWLEAAAKAAPNLLDGRVSAAAPTTSGSPAAGRATTSGSPLSGSPASSGPALGGPLSSASPLGASPLSSGSPLSSPVSGGSSLGGPLTSGSPLGGPLSSGSPLSGRVTQSAPFGQSAARPVEDHDAAALLGIDLSTFSTKGLSALSGPAPAVSGLVMEDLQVQEPVPVQFTDGRLILLTRCHEEWAQEAEGFLRDLCAAEKDILETVEDEVPVDVGSGTLMVRKVGELLLVSELVHQSDGTTREVDDLSRFLETRITIRTVYDAVGVAPQPFGYKSTALVWKGAMVANAQEVRRVSPGSPRGWGGFLIVPAGPQLPPEEALKDRTRYDTVSVAAIVETIPAIEVALSLPLGWKGRFANGELDAIFNPKGGQAWPA